MNSYINLILDELQGDTPREKFESLKTIKHLLIMKSPLQSDTDRIRRDCLILFEQSKGFEFRIKGTPLMDIADGVDWKNQTVKGRKYGDFHIDLCELTGKQNNSIEQ